MFLGRRFSPGRAVYMCGSPGQKMNIILSCISIASVRSKHCISELPLRVGLIHAE